MDIRSFFKPVVPGAAPKPASRRQTVTPRQPEPSSSQKRRRVQPKSGGGDASRAPTKAGGAAGAAADTPAAASAAGGTPAAPPELASFFYKPPASAAQPRAVEPASSAAAQESAPAGSPQEAAGREAAPPEEQQLEADQAQAAGMRTEPAQDEEHDEDQVEQDGEEAEQEQEQEQEQDEEDEEGEEDEGAGAALSAYEQLRLDNIKRNEAMLATLGIDGTEQSQMAATSRPRPKPKRKRPPKPVPTGPKRCARLPPPLTEPRPRWLSAACSVPSCLLMSVCKHLRSASSRLRGRTSAVNYSEDGLASAAAATAQHPPDEEEEEEEPEMDYDDSSVLRYTCDAPAAQPGTTAGDSAGADGRITGFRRRGEGERCVMYDDALTKTYAMSISGSLLCAGGHAGRVALFGQHTRSTNIFGVEV